LRDTPISKRSELVYNAFWLSPEREAPRALITETQRNVTGLVRLKLYKGNIIVAGPRKSEKYLRSEDRHDGRRPFAIDQSDANGFMRLNALRLKLPALRDESG